MSSFESESSGKFDPSKDTINDVPDWFIRYLRAALAGPLFSVPKPFETWMIDKVGTSGFDLPIGQIVGFSQMRPYIATRVNTSESTTSATYTDLSTTGPTLTGLPDGKYLVKYGATLISSGGGITAYMSPEINAVTAADADSISAIAATPGVSLTGVLDKSLANDGNNTLTMKYKQAGSGTANFAFRWLYAIRYSNV